MLDLNYFTIRVSMLLKYNAALIVNHIKMSGNLCE